MYKPLKTTKEISKKQSKKRKQIELSIEITKMLSFARYKLKQKGIFGLGNLDLTRLKKDVVLALYKETFNRRCSDDYKPRAKTKKISPKKKNIPKPKFNYSDPIWLAKRQEVFSIDNFKCRECNSEYNLQCHHSYYIHGRELWEYPLSSFVTLCGSCHTAFHKKIRGCNLVIRDRINVDNKIMEEELNGFYIKNKITK